MLSLLGMALGVREKLEKAIYGDQLYLYDGVKILAKTNKTTRDLGRP